MKDSKRELLRRQKSHIKEGNSIDISELKASSLGSKSEE
jgi:hypothetical protein